MFCKPCQVWARQGIAYDWEGKRSSWHVDPALAAAQCQLLCSCCATQFNLRGVHPKNARSLPGRSPSSWRLVWQCRSSLPSGRKGQWPFKWSCRYSRRKDTYRAVWQYNTSYTNRHTRFAVGPGTTTGKTARAQTADTARWLPLLILEIARACALNLPQARSPRRVSQARQGPAAVSHADHGSLHKHIAVRPLAPSLFNELCTRS